MDLKLLQGVGAAGTSALGRAAGTAAAGGGAGFAKALDSALKTVSSLQQESGSLQKQYQMGAETVSLEDTMVAMQKAQVGFQAAVTVRNRLVSAYTDIMNMQV
ncbi:MAG: flagellar hook-basal body complex protein FliE [Burkholderiaceae bacterium]|nr:flagellar hook-basal body complex protein FliE [Burkholderiaceae bacterium]